MCTVNVEYVNYDKTLYKTFPRVSSCKLYSKNGILNLRFITSSQISNLTEDVGYDELGKYISIDFGRWYNTKNNEPIYDSDFLLLNEQDTYFYEYVSCSIKIYVDGDYRCCFNNELNGFITVSLIPYKMLNFSETESDQIYYNFRG